MIVCTRGMNEMRSQADSENPDILLIDLNPSFPAIPPLGLEVLASFLVTAGFDARIFSASPFLPDYASRLESLALIRPRSIGWQIRNYDQAVLSEESPTILSFHKRTRRVLERLFPAVPMPLRDRVEQPDLVARAVGVDQVVKGGVAVELGKLRAQTGLPGIITVVGWASGMPSARRVSSKPTRTAWLASM